MPDAPKFSLICDWADDLFPAVSGYGVFEHGKEISAFFRGLGDAERYIKIMSSAPKAIQVAERLAAIVEDGYSPTDDVDDTILAAADLIRELFGNDD